MVGEYRVIDSDMHLFEPYDLWQKRMPDEFKSQAPVLDEGPGGILRVPGIKIGDLSIPEKAQTTISKPLDDLQKVHWGKGSFYDDALSRDFDAESTIEAMDIENVDIGVMYATHGRQVLAHDDIEPRVAQAIARAYNEWCAEFCSYDPERMRFAALVPFQDPNLAAEEIERAATENGAIAIMASPTPVSGHQVHDLDFAVVWETCERLNVAVGFHPTGVSSLRELFFRRFYGHPNAQAVGASIRNPVELMSAFSSMTLGGVLDRHRGLRVAFLEGTCGWLPWLLWRLDDMHEKYAQRAEVPVPRKPSESFGVQGYVAADMDEDDLWRTVAAIGDTNLVISTDYPHWDGPFPDGFKDFMKLENLTEQNRHRILGENCARLYDL